MIAFILAIIIMILAISKYNIHPFLSILTVSVIFGIIGGIPLVKTGKVLGIADVVSAGFAGTFNSIGIVIIMGALVGALLKRPGLHSRWQTASFGLLGKTIRLLPSSLWVGSYPSLSSVTVVLLF